MLTFFFFNQDSFSFHFHSFPPTLVAQLGKYTGIWPQRSPPPSRQAIIQPKIETTDKGSQACGLGSFKPAYCLGVYKYKAWPLSGPFQKSGNYQGNGVLGELSFLGAVVSRGAPLDAPAS